MRVGEWQRIGDDKKYKVKQRRGRAKKIPDNLIRTE